MFDGHDRIDHPASRFKLVAVAGSFGGLKACVRIVSDLPADFPVPVVIVLHIGQDRPSLLADILSRRTPLRVKEAEDGDLLRGGTVYTPAPGRHLWVNPDGTLTLFRSPRVHFVRPSADVLFASAAAAYREQAVAVVLTGGGCDGADGVREVGRRGGVVIAQDEATSECCGMPYNALLTGHVDHVLPLDQIAVALRTLVGASGMALSPERVEGG